MFARILQVNLRYPHIPYIFVHIYCALVYSTWYQAVPSLYKLVIPVTPVVARAHNTTKLHQLKRLWTRAEVDGGANLGPPQMPLGSKSVALLLAFEGQSSMHKYIGSKDNFAK